MAVQQIIGKKITKFDLTDPNFKPPEKKDIEEIDGNVADDSDENMYGEKTHTYQPDNGNLQMSEFMTGVLNKLDGLKHLNPEVMKDGRAVEVDIKREISVGKVDISALKSKEVKGKVMNKKDKLKALRNRRK